MSATDIIAYTYRAEILCPSCTIEAMIHQGDAAPAAADMRPEDVLDQVAGANAFDRYDETTFDSGDFPKVVFASSLEYDEACECCGRFVTTF